MKLKHKSYLAAKYLFNHFRRYVFLALAISLGFGVITVMTSLSEGMSRNVHDAARYHYGGDLFILGYKNLPGWENPGLIKDDKAVYEAIAAAGISPDRIVKRTSCFKEGTVFFAGNAVRQKYLHGLDWKNERETLERLNWVEGGLTELTENDNSILLSETTAKELSVRTGDDVVVQAITVTGQKNTCSCVVRGIFRDSSLFGAYKSYMSRGQLNRLLNMGEEGYSLLGLYYESDRQRDADREKLYPELASRLNIVPPIYDKNDLHKSFKGSWEGIRYLLVPLDVYVSQISDLMTAMDIVSYYLYIMIVLIVLVSITITYRLILHERTTEIGTMRAVGLQREDMTELFVLESVFLFLVSIAAGWIVALMVLGIISLFPFNWMPGIEIFMKRGRLVPFFSLKSVIFNIVLLFGITLPAVYLPANKAARKEIYLCLAEEK